MVASRQEPQNIACSPGLCVDLHPDRCVRAGVAVAIDRVIILTLEQVNDAAFLERAAARTIHGDTAGELCGLLQDGTRIDVQSRKS